MFILRVHVCNPLNWTFWNLCGILFGDTDDNGSTVLFNMLTCWHVVCLTCVLLFQIKIKKGMIQTTSYHPIYEFSINYCTTSNDIAILTFKFSHQFWKIYKKIFMCHWGHSNKVVLFGSVFCVMRCVGLCIDVFKLINFVY